MYAGYNPASWESGPFQKAVPAAKDKQVMDKAQLAALWRKRSRDQKDFDQRCQNMKIRSD
jgi:hypothetical protein